MLILGGVRISSIAKIILFSRRKADMIIVEGVVGAGKMRRSLMVRLLVNNVTTSCKR
jgi:hypothetical protein